MKELIKRLLREYDENTIQRIKFEGFSDPVLIPQFNKYLVKFNGTAKTSKIPDSEKIIFEDNDGKEYVFNSTDVQKSGNSPFYISLDVLRRYYDIKFKDDFVKHKEKLTPREYLLKLREVNNIYISDGRCKTNKCSELRNVIESSLKEIYGDDYGDYISDGCEPTQGFLNVYPLEDTYDENGNQWSKLNYIIFKEKAVSSILMSYLKIYGTFEHNDFIDWVKENKEKLFSGQFLELMIKNIRIPKPKSIYGEHMMDNIKTIFPDAKLISKFCPTTRKDYNENIVISDNGKQIIFQPVSPKSSKVLMIDGKYYITFSRRDGAPILNRKANYIITNTGTIFENSDVISGKKMWQFINPPIYYDQPFQTELKKYDKIR